MVAEGETSIEYWPPKLNRLLDLLKERRGVAITSTKPSGFPTGSPIATVPLYTSPVVTTTTALPTSPLTTKSPATSAPPSSTPASIANDGWKECVDATTGRKYYWNKLTRVTQWHPPPCFAKPGEVAEEEKSDSASGTESDSGDDNCDESTPLAPGWKEVCDSTGRKYYYNPSTKVTQWKRPTAS
ncbi:hypothetical protein Pelo_13042 [Pelomyxa schiedti]|nr:hypothetical protein Pelo_13042 [Pelomyxa schiedti]